MSKKLAICRQFDISRLLFPLIEAIENSFLMSRCRQRRRCRDYGYGYGDVSYGIDDDRDVPDLTTHNDESNRVISASLKAHSLEVTVAYSCVRDNKAAQSVKQKFIRDRASDAFSRASFFRKTLRYYAPFLKAWRCATPRLISIIFLSFSCVT